MQLQNVKLAFRQKFGAVQYIVRAPGRVNLIGEHTDYNEGFVFPTAIDPQVLIAASPGKNDTVRVYSLDYDEDDSFDLNAINSSADKQWSNYLRGVVSVLQKRGYKIGPFDAVVTGNVPQGAGLSSSAAYEVAVATLLSAMNNLNISPKDIALISQQAENQFVGVQCGIMDQYISALGQEEAALVIDCRSLESRAVSLDLAAHDCAIVITNSGVQRGLVDSQYNARREQCQQGTAALSALTGRPMKSLRDIELAEFDSLQNKLDPLVAKRCRHVISENQRVLDAVAALERNDLSAFGALMHQSHLSMKNDFEISCAEMDLLVDLSRSHPGVIGARMTGGGFGGCSVAIMQNSGIPSYKSDVIQKYQKESGKKATVYVCRSTPGASLVPV